MGWSYKRNLYFGFGHSSGKKRKDGVQYISDGYWTQANNTGETNQILKFDVKRNKFSFFATKGNLPVPECDECFICAKMGPKIYVCGYKQLFVLCMRTKTWTILCSNPCLSRDFLRTFTTINSKQLMLVGGQSVEIYKVSSTSSRNRELPRNAALYDHKAVVVKENHRVSKIYIIGGVDKNRGDWNKLMFEFNIEGNFN